MKKLTTALCLLLVFVMALTPVCYAAGENTDTLADWDIRVTVPDGATAVLEDDEYYIYAEDVDYIPYVMLTTYDYDSVEEFIPAFTKYMKKNYKDLKVTAEAKEISVGDKSGWEIDYGYKVSGYTIRDRRIAVLHDDLVYPVETTDEGGDRTHRPAHSGQERAARTGV